MRLTGWLLAKMPEYWSRYIDRCKNLRCKPARYVYLRGWVGEDYRKYWIHFDEEPYTKYSHALNKTVGYKKHNSLINEELLEPIKKWTVLMGDRVEVMVGRDKGKQGIVNKIVKERNWVFVEGLNTQFDYENHVKTQMPLDVTTEVKLVHPATEKPAKSVEWRYTKEGELVRVAEPSSLFLPIPKDDAILDDGTDPLSYIENEEKDTTEEQLLEPTYEPKLKSFESDILDNLGIDIDNEQKRGKTYWY